MTQGRRDWREVLDDNAVLSALDAAAREDMRAFCDQEPEDCDCAGNQMTPLAAAEWIITEVLRRRRGDDDSTLADEHRSVGALRRWDRTRLEAVAG